MWLIHSFWFRRTMHVVFMLLALHQNLYVAASNNNDDEVVFYVVQESWHTGIILKTSSVPDTLWPNAKDFSNYNFIDIGWGDEKFYQIPGISIPLAIRAVLLPTSSVFRVHGFNSSPLKYYGYATLFKIEASPERFQNLVSFIVSSFKVDVDGNLIQSDQKGFYKAKRSYHLFRTCNTWVGLGLKTSGYPIESCFLLTRKQLIRRLNRIESNSVKRIF